MENEKLFYARLDDAIGQASGGRIVSTAFYTPEECRLAESYLEGRCGELAFRFSGGYGDAERKLLILYPNYFPEESICEDDFLRALKIKISGYVTLDHRAYLGALMAIGIKRETLGDILCLDDGAVVFVVPAVESYLLSEPAPLTSVGRDRVRLLPADPAEIAAYRRQYEEADTVVASMRFDCILAGFGRLSREKAKSAIERGDARLNDVTEQNPSKICSVGDVLSLRGMGKFKITDSKVTKKDRIRLSVLIYR